MAPASGLRASLSYSRGRAGATSARTGDTEERTIMTVMPTNREAPHPVSAHERIDLIDVVRGFALFGVLLADLVWITITARAVEPPLPKARGAPPLHAGGLLDPAHLGTVIDLEFPAMRTYFRPEKFRDNGLLRRVAWMEYLVTRLGSKVTVGPA